MELLPLRSVDSALDGSGSLTLPPARKSLPIFALFPFYLASAAAAAAVGCAFFFSSS
jgi:hypothetical protein